MKTPSPYEPSFIIANTIEHMVDDAESRRCRGRTNDNSFQNTGMTNATITACRTKVRGERLDRPFTYSQYYRYDSVLYSVYTYCAVAW